MATRALFRRISLLHNLKPSSRFVGSNRSQDTEPSSSANENGLLNKDGNEKERLWFSALTEVEGKERKETEPMITKPKSFLKSYTFAPYVNESETLQKLVELGVDLSLLEQKYNAADFFVKLDWDKDVKPLIEFLLKYNVPITALGDYFTRNPWIFQQKLEDLQVRVNYLESKNFSSESIGRIILSSRYWLNLSVRNIDKRLGWFQKEFKLTGDELRFVVTRVPKLITFGTGHIEVLQFVFHEQLGFSVSEMKELLLKDPKLWMTSKQILDKTFDYLHNVIGLSHRRILDWPRAMRFRRERIRQRHEFLKSINRDQYDPQEPNYVSLRDLVEDTDRNFCHKIAKCHVNVFNNFLKNQ